LNIERKREIGPKASGGLSKLKTEDTGGQQCVMNKQGGIRQFREQSYVLAPGNLRRKVGEL